MSKRKRVFLDIETTGLNPTYHEITEIGYVCEVGKLHFERSYRLPVTLVGAESTALLVNHFDPYKSPVDDIVICEVPQFRLLNTGKLRHELLDDLGDAEIIGNNVQFDCNFLAEFLGSRPWRYHVVDVKAYIGGHLGWEPPWKTDKILQEIGWTDPVAHTGIDDARMARAMFKFVSASVRETVNLGKVSPVDD